MDRLSEQKEVAMRTIETWKAAASLIAQVALIGAGVALRMKQFARAVQRRRNVATLAGFDDRMLADIGLTRSDVIDAFSSPLWEDPTLTLRSRALERRLSRHHITLGLREPQVTAPPIAPDAGGRPKTDLPARHAA
jgi:uncharacterized protein YjiS (DUF1127 family)